MPFLSPNRQCQSNEVKSITCHAHLGVLQPCFFTTKGSWLLWERVAPNKQRRESDTMVYVPLIVTTTMCQLYSRSCQMWQLFIRQWNHHHRTPQHHHGRPALLRHQQMKSWEGGRRSWKEKPLNCNAERTRYREICSIKVCQILLTVDLQ